MVSSWQNCVTTHLLIYLSLIMLTVMIKVEVLKFLRELLIGLDSRIYGGQNNTNDDTRIMSL